MKQLITLILYIHLAIMNVAQQPAHFIWGQEELAGVDIYDLHQDVNNDYWIATNKGVIKYDGRVFQFFEMENAKSKSVFNLVENSKGEIFCNNLSGQVFKVNNSHCSLFFQVPDSLMSPYIYIELDDQDELLVSAKHLFRIIDNDDFEVLNKYKSLQYSELLKRADGSVWFHPTNENYLCVWGKGILKKVDFKNQTFKEATYLSMLLFEKDNDLYCYNSTENILYRQKEGEFTQIIELNTEEELVRFNHVKGDIWSVDSRSGAKIFDANGIEKNNGKMIFKSHFISSILEDNEGNVLLGTLGEGLLFIPNNPAEEIVDFPPDEKIESLSVGMDSSIYVGTVGGNIFKIYNGNIIQLDYHQKKSIEFLKVIGNELFIGNINLVAIDLGSNKLWTNDLGSVKDINNIGKDTLLIATNTGVKIFTKNREGENYISTVISNNRSFSIAFDSINETSYIATSRGVGTLNKEGVYSELLDNDSSIYAKALLYHNGNIYIGTNKEIIVVKDREIINNWTEFPNVDRLKGFKNKIIFSNEDGLKIIDANGNVIHEYGVSDGVYSNNIKDFIVVNNSIWFSHHQGLQKVLTDEGIQKKEYCPSIRVELLLVEGKEENLETTIFSDQQRKFQFVLNSPSKRNKEEIFYVYQLEGIDDDWLQNTYYNNIIEYKSLPPGNYNFKAKAVFRGCESEIVQFSFNIEYPYYRKTWFYLVSILLGMSVLALTFKIQLNRQKKKASQQNELNASKLTAIQSQMNPHFIFNALNSIQDLVLKGDVDNSYTYITKFANLVRRTLNYSDKDFIEFESEVKLIDLYLTLEKLRFKKEFNYEIITHGIEDVLVPPMLVQPFIENALVHGLLHKEGLKSITINFKLEEELICEITDNGIGRKKAADIKERQRSDHESFSVNAIKKRFEILKSHFGGDLGFEYVDLEEDGIVLGTKVILRIPIKRIL